MYDILKSILNKRGISIESFAESLRITTNTLRRNLTNNPRLSTIEEVANKLNIHATELFDRPTQESDISQISGFIKVDNNIKEVKSISDLKDIIYSIEDRELLK